MQRINIGKAAPNLYKALIEMDKLASETVTQAGIAEGFYHLLLLRASQINECAFCIRMHAKDALNGGESNDRLAVLPAWRETEYFSQKERAALTLVEAITLIAEGQVPDAIYQEAEQMLSSEEIVAIEWLAIVINAWNRVAISSRYIVKP